MDDERVLIFHTATRREVIERTGAADEIFFGTGFAFTVRFFVAEPFLLGRTFPDCDFAIQRVYWLGIQVVNNL
jgi:hypothetical protein